MPGWGDGWLSGSIQGAPFHMPEDEATIARHVAIHHRPDSPTTTTDLGAPADTFILKAFVLGDDYQRKRDAVLDAFRYQAPYDLVHPHYGPMQVALNGEVKVRHTEEEIRKCYIEIPLLRLSDPEPFLLDDTAPEMVFAADSFAKAVESQPFTSPETKPSFLDLMNDGADMISRVQGRIASALDVLDQTSNAVDRYTDRIHEIASLPDQVAAKTTGLLLSVMGLLSVTRPSSNVSPSQDSQERIGALQEATITVGTFGDDLPEDPEDQNEEDEAEATNLRALRATFRLSGLAESARNLAGLQLESAQQAEALADTYLELFDLTLEDAATSGVIGPSLQAAQTVRAAISRHLRAAAASLEHITTYTPPAPMSVIMISQLLYGHPGRADEIAERNALLDPNFVLPGIPLEVRTQ